MQNSTNKPTMQNRNQNLSLINAYGDLYFYFRSDHLFRQYILDVGRSLNIRGGFNIVLEHLQKLVSKKVPVPKGEFPISCRFRRIRGTHVQFLNRILGTKLDALEGNVSRLTKRSGRGGIKNPKFPSGEKLMVALSRLAATTLADGHLKPNGTIEYFEPELERIKLVEKTLRVFGDIRANPKLVKRDNVYVCYFPSPLGKALQYYGLIPGNKSILNPKLPSFILEGSLRTLCAFFEDFVPQDGSITSKSKRFELAQSNTLDSGINALEYPDSPELPTTMVDFLKRHGKQEQTCWVLSISKLRRLSARNRLAQDLVKQIETHTSNLIEDSVRVAQRLGVSMESKPCTVRYFNKTGKVTISWVARTGTIDDTIRLGIIAPPNDVKKRHVLKQIMMTKPRLVARTLRNLTKDDIAFDIWWN